MKIAAALLIAGGTLFAQLNTLTPKEASDGWLLLFDGQSTFGWTSEGKAGWRVADGALIADAGENGWLRSNSPFADFQLKCDYRTGAEGNSGIFVRTDKPTDNVQTGIEIQVDRPAFRSGYRQHPYRGSGGNPS